MAVDHEIHQIRGESKPNIKFRGSIQEVRGLEVSRPGVGQGNGFGDATLGKGPTISVGGGTHGINRIHRVVAPISPGYRPPVLEAASPVGAEGG